MARIKIVHIITELSLTSGAGTMLYKLLSTMDTTRFDCEVISLTEIGPVGRKIETLAIPVRALGMDRRYPNPLAIFRLTLWLIRSAPGLVQTWMYHADLFGGVAAKIAGNIPVVWGVRHSALPMKEGRLLTRWTTRFCALLSQYLPRRIVYCSETARTAHARLGYRHPKMIVIPTGFDLHRFRKNTPARLRIRQELNIPDDALLIGLVAPFDPQKDHQTFVLAAAQLARINPSLHFLLGGREITSDNQPLTSWINNTGCPERFHLLGQRHDVQTLLAALDIACSSSSGEGFPAFIGEAMACAIPVVATDAGDSAWIVGETGRIIPSGDSTALTAACQALIQAGHTRRSAMGWAARRRIENHFDLPDISRRYEKLYQEVVDRRVEKNQEKRDGGPGVSTC